MFSNKPPPKGLNLREPPFTQPILRQIVRKMQYRSQAVLAMTSHFGESIVKSHGAQLIYVKGYLDGARTTILSQPPTRFIWEIENQPMCLDQVQKDDVVVVYNNQDVTEMKAQMNMEELYYEPGCNPPHIIFRRPRKHEIITVPIDIHLREQTEPALGFNIAEDMPAKRRLIIDQVHWRTAAEKAGLQWGDEILTINGKSPKYPHYADIIQQLTEEKILRLTVRRIGFEH